MTWTIKGQGFQDEHGRHAFLHGINFVDKNPEKRPAGVPPWTDHDLAQAASWGLNGVRLGVIWAAAMPAPGRPDQAYLTWLTSQVEACHRAGLHVVLDAHQDLYAQAHSDGAPAWATLTEPVTGSLLPRHFELLIGAFAQLTVQDPMRVAADWEDPEAKFAQLQHLDDPELHRALGDAVAPALAEFDASPVAEFYQRVGGAIRSAGHEHVILRENTYLSNMGVPCLAPLPEGIGPVAFSPHAYDLVVDTPAVTMASDRRVLTILERHAELQQRWDRPSLLGEWGALSTYDGVAGHSHAIQDFVDEHLWSQTYWCWEPAFSGTDAQLSLVRPRAHAVVGTVESIIPGELWAAEWVTTPEDVERAGEHAHHAFFVPEGATVEYAVDGEPRTVGGSGRVQPTAEPGRGRLVVRR